MPFGDRTGPTGMGPMTGRGAGYCAGSGAPGFASPIPRRGWFGFGQRMWGGRGGGWGRGRGWHGVPYGYGYAPWGGIPQEQDTAVLEEQARALEVDLDSIRKRLEELKK